MGYYLVFRIRQIELKAEVKTYLRSHPDDQVITHFEFTLRNGDVIDPGFSWEDESEFEFNSNMYDLIEKTIDGDRMVVKCVKDEEENQLIKAFEHFQGKQSRHGKSRTGSLSQFFASSYVTADATDISHFNYLSSTEFNIYNSLLLDCFNEITTPPPKSC